MIITGNINMFVACSWRSGSTHIARGLSGLTGFRHSTTVGFHGEGVEQQVINHVSAGVLFPYGNQVFHQHTFGTPRNILLLKAYNVKPVVLVRNIFDSLVSLQEWISAPESAAIPGLATTSRWGVMTEHERYEWLAYNATPWFVAFYTSWDSADIEKLLIRYEDFYANQHKGFQTILDWYGIQGIPSSLIDAVAASRFNYRTGKAGRGAKLFPADLFSIVKRQLDISGIAKDIV